MSSQKMEKLTKSISLKYSMKGLLVHKDQNWDLCEVIILGGGSFTMTKKEEVERMKFLILRSKCDGVEEIQESMKTILGVSS